MTPAMRNVLVGGTGLALAKLHFKTSWPVAVIAGLAAAIVWDMVIDPD